MDERTAKWEARFDPLVIVAAIVTIPLLVLDQTHHTGTWHDVARIGDWVVWLVFLVALVVMLVVSPAPLQHLRRHPLELLVVVLTPPFLPLGVQWVRVLRVLRVVRVMRLAPMLRRAFSLEGIEYAALLAMIALFGGAAAFSAADKISYGEGVYWALQTMTTVTYGDVIPHSALAKVIASLLMVVGIGFFALVTGAIAQRFLAIQVQDAVHDLATEEEELIGQIRMIEQQLELLQTTIQRRTGGAGLD